MYTKDIFLKMEAELDVIHNNCFVIYHCENLEVSISPVIKY
jgi:hypothetical protein